MSMDIKDEEKIKILYLILEYLNISEEEFHNVL